MSLCTVYVQFFIKKNTTQGSVVLYVKVKDLDLFSSDDLVDRIYVLINDLMPGESTAKIETTGVFGNGKIKLRFQLECWEHFYGRNCAIFCIPIDDNRGHFDCGPNGEVICLNGWQDPANHCLTRKYFISLLQPCLPHA